MGKQPASTTEIAGLTSGQRVRALGDIDVAIRGTIVETYDFACLVRWDDTGRTAYVFSVDLLKV